MVETKNQIGTNPNVKENNPQGLTNNTLFSLGRKIVSNK